MQLKEGTPSCMELAYQIGDAQRLTHNKLDDLLGAIPAEGTEREIYQGHANELYATLRDILSDSKMIYERVLELSGTIGKPLNGKESRDPKVS
jgi:hypothetical protein